MFLRVAAIAMIGMASIAASSPARGVQDFGWMSGAWVSESKGEWTEEHWTSPRGGTLLGTNRSGKGDKTTGYEFMRIAADADGTIRFWASPSGKPPVGFKLVSSGPKEAVFENPANDYPTRVVYRRVGDTLHGTIYGPRGKNPMSWTFRRPASK